ncbi:MAG TPA: ABC transporter permease [Candidatus Limnocylindrales bacterium]
MSLLKLLVRILAFTGKEVVETMRRPGAIVSLIVGPFLILLAFGLSYNGVHRVLNAVIVVPPGSGLPTDPGSYRAFQTQGVQVTQVMSDEGAARAELDSGKADMVIVAPEDPKTTLAQGRQATIRVEYSVVDPIRAANADYLARQVSDEVNRQVIKQAAAQGETQGAANGVAGANAIPPDVLAQPTVAETANLSPTQPNLISYFGPAAIALILQHIAVTLIALALVRERSRGRPEIFRLSPTGTAEIVAGKIIAFLILGSIVASLLVASLLLAFHVPILSSFALVALVLFLLLLASLAFGTAIAAVSDSERQAVQLALLMLLTSVFFSGFVLSIDEFQELGQGIAAVLPVTHGVRLLQDLMLRGVFSTGDAVALAVIAAVLFVPSVVLLRRSLVEA